MVDNTLNAIKEIVKTVPVYEDAIRSAAKKVGKSLETVAKVINLVLLTKMVVLPQNNFNLQILG